MYELSERGAERDLKKLPEDQFQRILPHFKDLSINARPPGSRKIRLARLAEREALDAIRPELDGDAVMARLGIPPGKTVGRALQFLLEIRLEEGLLGADEVGRRLDAWWDVGARRSGAETGVQSPAAEPLDELVRLAVVVLDGRRLHEVLDDGPMSGNRPVRVETEACGPHGVDDDALLEFGESQTSSFSSTFNGTVAEVAPSIRT